VVLERQGGEVTRAYREGVSRAQSYKGLISNMSKKSGKVVHLTLLAAFVAGSVVVSNGRAQSPQGQEQEGVPAAKPAAVSTPYRNQPPRISNREAAYLEAVWGIADPSVKTVESGVIIRFSYRVLDPQKAKPLTDKKLNPVLESPEKGLRLVVPSMEKVGQLRQAPPLIEEGKSYWMAFSNSGRQIKPGDRVDIVIGNFHARGLQVE
jgi:hypothetical protein